MVAIQWTSKRGEFMSKLLSVFLLALSLPISVATAQTLEDALQTIDNYLGPKSLTESFQVGDRFKQTNDDVTTFFSVTQSQPLEAKIEIRGQDGKLIAQHTLTLERWLKANSNAVRMWAANMQSYGWKLEMEVVDLVEVRVMLNGRPARLNGLKATYSGVNGVGMKLEGEVVVTNGLPGMAQMVYRRENQMGMDRKWSVVEFKRGNL